MEMSYKPGPLGRSLAGIALVLALVVVGLGLVSLMAPVPGQAAPAAAAPRERAYDGLPGTEAVTHTAYLPFIGRQVMAGANAWLAQYYANMNLSGEPARTAREARLDYDWGDGAPEGLPKNYFSARWSGSWHFEHGEYTFFVLADDGVRLWLDGSLLLDGWSPGIYDRAIKQVIDEGPHNLKLEYFEGTGDAAVRLFWYRTDLYPQWKGNYYPQPWVEGSKLYEQTDRFIEFEWGDGCPTGLSCDSFSIAWNATPVFVTGTHRILIYADDGYQLYVDGNKVKEGGWYGEQIGGGEDAYYDLTVGRLEQHDITYNFHDRGGLAEARLWLQDLEQPDWTVEYYNNPTPSGAPVATKKDEAIFHDWKWGKPHRDLSSDHFSIRWSGQRYFHSGCYRFGLFADDGVRLWVDGELLVDEWHDGRGEYFAPVTYLSSGEHTVIVEYYENTGEAEIRFWW